MMTLVTENGRWALRNGNMMFSNVVAIGDRNEALRYHLVDEEGKDIPMEGTVFDYIVDDGIPTDRE